MKKIFRKIPEMIDWRYLSHQNETHFIFLKEFFYRTAVKMERRCTYWTAVHLIDKYLAQFRQKTKVDLFVWYS